METTKDAIRQTVRKNYAKIATGNKGASEMIQAASCCGEQGGLENAENSSAGCGCGETSITPDKLSAVMGYSKDEMAAVPEGANLGLGCGNPVALASLKPGETVVDLGSGGGFDCFLAARQVGETGRVIGIDMTPDMISKARSNVDKSGLDNIEFRLGEIEHLPVPDNTADIIISNCVINLSPDKPSVFQDAFRALKPGGRLSVSDIVATAELPDEIKKNLALVSACIGGAATIEQTKEMLEKAGFVNINIKPKDESRAIINEWTPGQNSGDYVVSAYIEAIKPD
ncbi:arsenite methyltransferase [Desulfobacterales bacterium HSG17]|nr:arsenite methyltransferase [Desulfobacterales bacterium HSG17]